MNNLIIIDDSTCKEELKSFLSTHSDHVKLLLTEQDYNIDLDVLIEKLYQVFSDQKILFLKTLQGIMKVAISDIFYINQSDENISLYLSDGSKHILPESIMHYAHSLKKYGIIRVNSKTLINSRYIESYIMNLEVLFCKGKKKFDVENQYKKLIINELNKIEQIK